MDLVFLFLFFVEVGGTDVALVFPFQGVHKINKKESKYALLFSVIIICKLLKREHQAGLCWM
jgi:hypothetical protein